MKNLKLQQMNKMTFQQTNNLKLMKLLERVNVVVPLKTILKTIIWIQILLMTILVIVEMETVIEYDFARILLWV